VGPNSPDVKAGSGDCRVVRCAIYARKSTEEGLSQPCNSLEVQRESAEAYISSQKHMGWTVLGRRYDDGGYTGANLERPALRALMGDIESGQVDCVLVYKVDRLSRSLLDFARLMGAFEAHGVHLVSVTQQMNTTDSLGRLTLNILLSFAHYAECAIMQSHSVEVAVWRAFRWRGTPHYPGSNSEAISASGRSAQHRLPVVTVGAGRPFSTCMCSLFRAMNVVSARHHGRPSLYL
jgi:predicted site-specific integrase-resolvase